MRQRQTNSKQHNNQRDAMEHARMVAGIAGKRGKGPKKVNKTIVLEIHLTVKLIIKGNCACVCVCLTALCVCVSEGGWGLMECPAPRPLKFVLVFGRKGVGMEFA